VINDTTMKKSLLLFPITIALAIFFYPTTSNSLSTGSPGGKTGSPNDNGNCMGCHTDAQMGLGAMITTDIPGTGYEPGNTYNITVEISPAGIFASPKGFEVTCEENTTNTKAGLFGTTDPTGTQVINNGTAITHTTAGNIHDNWIFNWVAPIAGTGEITFYGAFIEGKSPIGNNQGDIFSSTALSFGEAIVNSVNDLSAQNDFTFNTITKKIETINTVSVYDISGKLVLVTDNKTTNISNLKNGIYILKSEIKTQKIILN
jgi:hypothetical protein